MKKHTSQHGFTLIELLVVIAIIGVLASVVLASLNSARTKARDTERITEIRELQKALELYYLEYGHYPNSSGCGASVPNGNWCNSKEGVVNNHWIRDAGTTNLGAFISKDPLDPLDVPSANWTPVGGGAYFYFSNGYGGTGKWYMIVFGLENTSHDLQDQDGVVACNGSTFHYGSGSNGIITIGQDCTI